MELLIVIVLVVLLFTALILLRGLVLQYLWSWFLTPFGLPEIGLAHAIGVALIISFLTHQYDSSEQKDGEGLKRVGYTFLGTLFVWLVGWIIFKAMH